MFLKFNSCIKCNYTFKSCKNYSILLQIQLIQRLTPTDDCGTERNIYKLTIKK